MAAAEGHDAEFQTSGQDDQQVDQQQSTSDICSRLGETNWKVDGGTSLTMKKMDPVNDSSKSIYEEVFLSCRDVIEKQRSRGNGVYKIRTGNTSTMTYCHMDALQACGGGGWTLVMKIDGGKKELPYNANQWTQATPMSTDKGLDLSKTTAVLPTYWTTPLTQICLGVKQTGNDTKWLKLTLKASAISLMDVVAGSDKLPFQALNVNDWAGVFAPGKSVTSPTSQGVSLVKGDVKIRIGLAWNDASGANGFMGIGCYDSWGGYGYSSISCGYGLSNFVGTETISSFCYVLVQ